MSVSTNKSSYLKQYFFHSLTSVVSVLFVWSPLDNSWRRMDLHTGGLRSYI